MFEMLRKSRRTSVTLLAAFALLLAASANGCDALDNKPGLVGQYFASTDFTGSSSLRIETTIDHSWADGESPLGINSADFSARWTGGSPHPPLVPTGS